MGLAFCCKFFVMNDIKFTVYIPCLPQADVYRLLLRGNVFQILFYGKLGVVRILNSQWGFTRPSSIFFFSLGIVRDIVPLFIYSHVERSISRAYHLHHKRRRVWKWRICPFRWKWVEAVGDPRASWTLKRWWRTNVLPGWTSGRNPEKRRKRE